MKKIFLQECKNAIKKMLTDPRARFDYFTTKGFTKYMSDEKFLKKRYKLVMAHELNLEEPVSFNEKLQWLKLYDRREEYIKMVDKYAVKEYVADLIGEEYIIPTLGVWENFEDIDFSLLPKRFVLKCTHDSGGLVVCKDKDKLNIRDAKKKINRCLKRNFFWIGREWPYKNVKPRIIAEKYLEDNRQKSLIDYKFYCFDGEPKFLYISAGLEEHSTAEISFVTLDWKIAKFQRSDYKQFKKLPDKPTKFDDMINIAKKLSYGHSFLRVDLYQINDKVFFSELTFFPCSGYMPFTEKRHDNEIGKMIQLPMH